MKQTSRIKRLCSALAALALAAGVPLWTAFAAPAVDLTAPCSVKVHCHGAYDAATAQEAATPQIVPLAGVTFALHPVAALQKDGTLALLPAYAGSGVDVNSLDTAEKLNAAAKTLADFTAAAHIAGTHCTTDAAGLTVYTGLLPGLYLLRQTGTADPNLNWSTLPALIVLPQQDAAGTLWQYDADLFTKGETAAGAVRLMKTDPAGAALHGAVFRMEKKVYVTARTPLPQNAQKQTDTTGDYWWNVYAESLAANGGVLLLENLAQGEYRFVETASPAGYVLDAAPRPFVARQGQTAQLAVVNEKQQEPPAQPVDATMPKTGGDTTLWRDTLLGALLVAAGAAVGFFALRRRVPHGKA